ncbi:MAG: homocysteine S-methyltransferase family protein [Verrucomicrobia bacterium]|nr:homocysteine S-methyltransferase family protein [Verrucomicrobiota bacterium]
MADFLTTLKSQPLLTDGAMGSYLFELTGRLSEANHVYEAFNVDQPDLVRRVHRDYLAAGAQCVKTNTFGANRHQLQQFGLEHRVAALNGAGVRVAREAATEPIFVLASIGPTAQPLTEPAAVAECYREQIESLTAAGADALLLETFSSQRQLELLIELIRSFPKAPPIIAEITYRPELPPLAFVRRMAELGAAVAGVNCCAPWDASAFVDAAQHAPLPLVVMPNAGGFQRIGSRFMTSVNPEFVGKFARSLMDRGVRLIGGCCEMHPPHIREMHNYLRSRQAGAVTATARVQVSRPPVGDAEKKANGPFSRKLKENRFVVSVEMLPPRGTDGKLHESKIEFIRQLAEIGLVDAVDFTDGSRGIPLMPPGDFILLARERLGWTAASGDQLELIPHFTGRDLNVMGVQSRLVGYHAHRIRNVLFITGDPPKMSPTYPRSTAVFDLDSVGLVRLTHTCLNAGVDFGGAPLGKQADPRTHFTIGTGFEPEATDMRRELDRLRQKLDNGADYIMTQPAFRQEPLDVLEPFRARDRILVGVMLLTSFEQAERVARVPGVVLPDAILQRLAATPNLADQAKIGQEMAAEQIRWVRSEGWAGLYLMSPAGTSGVLDVLRAGLAV